MSNPVLRTPFGTVELRRAAPRPGSPDDVQVYILLPDLDELLGAPGFGLRNPIRVPPPACPSSLLGATRERATSLH